MTTLPHEILPHGSTLMSLGMPSRSLKKAFSVSTFVAREVKATLSVGFAGFRGWHNKVHHASAGAKDLVVLVHGLMATAAAFDSLVRTLVETLPVRVATFSYVPGVELKTLAERIHQTIAPQSSVARVHLVGHSLGGLASRWYVQEYEHDARVVQTISIASPFGMLGMAQELPQSWLDRLAPGLVQATKLVHDAHQHSRRIPHLSIVTDKDQIIGPAHNGILPGAPSFIVHDTGHNGVLFHRKTHRVIAQQIAQHL